MAFFILSAKSPDGVACETPDTASHRFVVGLIYERDRKDLIYDLSLMDAPPFSITKLLGARRH